jgi:hypothetical protein
MPISQLELDEAIALSEQNPNDLELAEAAITISDAFKFEKQQRQDVTRTLFTDPNHGLSSDQLSDLTNMVNGDEERKYKLFNKRYFEEFGGLPKDQVDLNIDQLINAYGVQEFKKPISTHKEFHDAIKGDFLAEDQVAAMAREFTLAKMGPLDSEAQFRERMESVPGYAGREAKWGHEFFRIKDSFESRLDPHRTTVKLLSASLKQREGVGADRSTLEAATTAREEMLAAPSFEEMTQLVMGVPAEDRKLVIAAAIAESANDEAGRKSVLQGLLESFDRGVEGGVANIKGTASRSVSIAIQRDIENGVEVPVGKEASPEEYLEAVRLRVLGGEAYELQAGVMGAVAGKQFATPSEEVKQQALKFAKDEFEVGELADELRSAAQNQIDPITSDFIAVRGLYSAAQSLPYLATSLARGGFALNSMALAGDSYRSLRERNPTMTAEQAQTISMIAGPAQAYVEQISGKLLTSRLPAFNRYFNQIIGTTGSIPARFLARTPAILGAEMVQENVQDITPFVVQGALSALSEDMPNVPVELLYKEMLAQQPELFFAVLPLAIMGGGAGAYSDFRNGRELLSSYDELRAQGVSEARAAEIRSLAVRGDLDGAQSLLREEFKTLGQDQKSVQEARAEAIPKLVAEQKAALKAMQDGIDIDILPAILNERGKWTLRYKNGETTQYETHKEAMERFDAIASSALVSMHIDQVAAARLTTSQIEEGREIKFILSPLRPTTEEIQAQGVATEEQLAKRKEIEELDKGITPKDEERRAQVLAGMAANSSEARVASSYVLGSSQNTEAAPDSFGDRVIRTTARLYAGATAFTVIEETAEGDVKFMLQEGGIPRKWLISALRQWESTTGDALFRKSITDDTQVENQDIVEAYSKMVVSYFAGRAKAGDQGRIFSKEFRKEIADALRGDMGAVMSGYGSFYEAVYRRAAMIEKARKEGTLPADLESFLAKSAGMSPQKVFEREVVKEGEGIAEDMGVEFVDEETFSTMTPAQVTPQGKRHAELEDKFNAGTITEEETAEAQRLVDERAKNAGYNQEAWHYSERKFKAFDIDFARTASDIQAFFFKDVKDPNKEYGRNEYHVYLKLENPATYAQAVEGFSPAETDDAGIRQRNKLIQQGFDGAIVSREDGGMDYAEIIAFNPNQIKSADPFTGVPLDQRFDQTRDEITFSTISDFSNSRAIPANADTVTVLPDGARLVGPTTFSIMSFHGTPHKIDPREGFRMDKIGTGEGAQAYGWGLYFADSIAVAKEYQEILAGANNRSLGVQGEGKYIVIEEQYGDFAIGFRKSERMSRQTGLAVEIYKSGFDSLSEALDWAKNKKWITSNAKLALYGNNGFEQANENDVFSEGAQIVAYDPGNLYTVELLPNEEDLLDWDKPLSEQSEKVKAAILKIMAGGDQDLEAILDLSPDGMMMMGMIPSAKGSAAYATIGDPQKASERLLAAGIPGIRYLDGNSRNTGEGTYNYVIFDDKLIKIIEENGVRVDEGSTFSTITPDPSEHVFEAVYLKHEKRFKKAIRDGRARLGVSIEQFIKKAVLLHQPDTAVSGSVAFAGEEVVVGQGGVYYPLLFDALNYFWASTENAAKGMAERLNEISRANGGKIYMALTSAPITKLFSSTTMSSGVVDILAKVAKYPKRYGLTPDDVVKIISVASSLKLEKKLKNKKTGVTRTVVKSFTNSVPENVSLPKAVKLIKAELAADKSTFDIRHKFVKSIAAQIAKALADKPEQSKRFANLLVGETNEFAKGPMRKGKLSEVAILQGLGDLLSEPFLKTFQNVKTGGYVYAVIEMDGEVEAVPSDLHKSYPFAIRSTSKKKPTVHLIDKARKWHDVVGIKGQKGYVAKENYTKVYPTSGVSSKSYGTLVFTKPNPKGEEGVDITSFSTVTPAADSRAAKIKKKNSLRIQMSRSALTDAALNQASWRDWYDEHQEVLDDFFGDYAPLFQDILSITSQAASVKANVSLALRAFGYYVRGEAFDGTKRGEETPGFLAGVIMNLDRLRSDKQIQGQKIKAYKASNDGAVDQAVIDRHISRLLFGVETPSAAQFAKAQKVLSQIAKEIGWTARQVQAALWAHSIYKSGKTPESYGAYLTKLESKRTLAKRIGDIAGAGAGRNADGGGRGRFAPASTTPGETTLSVIRPIGDIDSRFTAMFSPFQRSPELRAKLGEEMRRRALEISKVLAPILRANRTAKSIDEERKQRFDALWQEKMEARISPSELTAIEAGKLDDASTRPILSELLRKKTYRRKDGRTVEYWAGSLMSKAEAKRRGMDTTSGEWDDIPEGLPSYVYGGGLAPDQAASMFGFDSIADFWSALENEIASWKNVEAISERISREIADITREARTEARAWATQALKERSTIGSDRATLIGFLRTLDAIQRTLPVEVRGKIGGFVALAKLTTPAAMLDEIERRVERIDSELEKYLKKEAEVRRKKLFKLTKPKREAGKKPKGKAGADIHDLFDRLAEAMLWDGTKAEGWATTLEAQIASGDLSPEAEAHAKIEANLVRLFSDWNDTYIDTGKKGKNGRRIVKLNSRGAGAARRTAAVEAAEEVWKAGYLAEQTRIAKERERRAQIRADIIAGTGKLGSRPERVAKSQKDAGLSGQWKEWFLSLFNFEQVLGFAFGDNSKWNQWFSDQQRTAENQKLDEIQTVLDGLDALFRKLGGSRLGGEKLQWKLSQPSFETKKGGKMSELEGITAILMWRQEDGKRHMAGKRDENGKITSTWAYDQAFVDEIQSKLSAEALEVMDYLVDQYAGEYETLNPIFREINGINLPRNDKYSPLSVKPQQAPNGQTTDPVTGSTMSNGSMTPGSLRTRAQVVAEPDFRNAIEVFVGHKKQLAHWKAYAVFIRDAQGVLGNREVSNSIEASSGQEAVRVIRSWLDLFAQGGVRDAGAHLALTKALSGAMGRASAIQLVGRLGTLAIQTTQLGAASAKMPFISYASRLSKLLTGRLSWADALNSPYIQRRLAQMPPSVQIAMEGLRAGKPNAVKHAVQRIGRLLAGTDALFTAGTFAIVYDYQLTKSLKAGVDPVTAAEVARNEAERIVDEIAQPTRQGTRSLFESTTTNPLGRVAWAFASEARKNMALVAYTGAKRPVGELSRALLYVIVFNGVLSSLIRTAWKDLRDDDEDEDEWSLQRILLSVATEPLYGFPGFGEIAQDAIFAAAGEYTPSGSILDAPKKIPTAIVRAPENFQMLLEGDLEQPLRDLETLLMAGGLFNDNIAAVSSLAHIVRDAEALIRNFTQD